MQRIPALTIAALAATAGAMSVSQPESITTSPDSPAPTTRGRRYSANASLPAIPRVGRRSKYEPHQSKRECARRVRQREAAKAQQRRPRTFSDARFFVNNEDLVEVGLDGEPIRKAG